MIQTTVYNYKSFNIKNWSI